MKRICENKNCGCEFNARPADVKRGWARFCSKSCKAIVQEKRTGQYKAFVSRRDNDDEYDYVGHPMQSGYFGHGQE